MEGQDGSVEDAREAEFLRRVRQDDKVVTPLLQLGRFSFYVDSVGDKDRVKREDQINDEDKSEVNYENEQKQLEVLQGESEQDSTGMDSFLNFNF